MKAIVTGGAGFLGSHLTEALLAEGARVIVFDRALTRNLSAVEDHSEFSFVAGDVRSAEQVDNVFCQDIDVVFHLAAIVGVSNYMTNPLGVVDVNIGGTRNVLDAAARTGSRVMLASTSEVYGRNPNVPWREDADRVLGSTQVDRWSYSTSKAASEHLALAMHRQTSLEVSVVRFFNVYGPRQAPIYVVSQSIQRVLCGQRPLLYDGGHQTRCFTYVTDAVRGAIAASVSPDAIGEVFNIGSERESTIREVLETIMALAGVESEWDALDTTSHYGDRYQDIPRRVPDCSKARRLLGWEAKTTLQAGLQHTINWAHENPWWSNADSSTNG